MHRIYSDTVCVPVALFRFTICIGFYGNDVVFGVHMLKTTIIAIQFAEQMLSYIVTTYCSRAGSYASYEAAAER